MVSAHILWDDGSHDIISVSGTGAAGSSTLTVSSDNNLTGLKRSKVVNIRTTDNVLHTLTIVQLPKPILVIGEGLQVVGERNDSSVAIIGE